MAERTGLITDKWPEPPATLLQRLEQIIDVWSDYPDDFIMIVATLEAYGPHIRTGLTMGDLRTLYRRERLGTDTAVYTSPADRLTDRLRGETARPADPPGPPENGNGS